MNVKKINLFLLDVAAHNNREWFQEHKAEYLAAKSDFEEGIRKAIAHYAGFDDEIAHLQVKDSVRIVSIVTYVSLPISRPISAISEPTFVLTARSRFVVATIYM